MCRLSNEENEDGAVACLDPGSTDAACFARASDSPFFRLARAFSWLHIFSVNKTLWISRLCTSDSPSVFEAETNKIYVRKLKWKKLLVR